MDIHNQVAMTSTCTPDKCNKKHTIEVLLLIEKTTRCVQGWWTKTKSCNTGNWLSGS